VKRFLLLLPFLAGAAGAVPLSTIRRPLVVTSPVEGRVTSLGGSVEIRSRVGGDVIVWGADVRLGPGADVAGDVVDFGGSVLGPPEAVRGRILTPGSLSALYLSEAQHAPWQSAAGSWRTAAGLRLFILAVWAVVASLVLRFWSSPVARAAIVFEEQTAMAAAAGVLGVAFLFFAAIGSLTAIPASGRVVVAAAILAAALALKIFGMTALFLFVGERLRARFEPSRRPAALALGIALCGAASLVPVAGPILWSAASVLAVGSALYTRFGSPRFRVSIAPAR